MKNYLTVKNFNYNSEEFNLVVENFIVNESEIIIIKGKNGTGKSFFLRQLFQPKIDLKNSIVFEKSFDELHKAINNGYVYIPQNIPIIDGITYEILWEKMKLKTDKIPNSLKKLRERVIGTCSGGENKLMEVTPWFENSFDILFLDEIESGLDEKNKNFVYKNIKDMVSKTKSSIVLVTHENIEFLNKVFENTKIKLYNIKNGKMTENE